MALQFFPRRISGICFLCGAVFYVLAKLVTPTPVSFSRSRAQVQLITRGIALMGGGCHFSISIASVLAFWFWFVSRGARFALLSSFFVFLVGGYSGLLP